MERLITYRQLLQLARVYLNFPTTAGWLLLLKQIRQYEVCLCQSNRRHRCAQRLILFIERYNDLSLARRGFLVYVEAEQRVGQSKSNRAQLMTYDFVNPARTGGDQSRRTASAIRSIYLAHRSDSGNL
jgi:hypothetical protein